MSNFPPGVTAYDIDVDAGYCEYCDEWHEDEDCPAETSEYCEHCQEETCRCDDIYEKAEDDRRSGWFW